MLPEARSVALRIPRYGAGLTPSFHGDHCGKVEMGRAACVMMNDLKNKNQPVRLILMDDLPRPFVTRALLLDHNDSW